MKLTTTHHLGYEPGRARLGACGHLRCTPMPAASFGGGNWTGSWQRIAPAAPATFFMSAVASTTGTGAKFSSIERTTRHLGMGST